MALQAGKQLGPYEIVGPIGAGGMGEVYRARDPRLERDVAIKILPDLFVADRERVLRFQREAQVLASLNHPNIAIIHDLQESGGLHALVLELVEGPTLADRIAQGPIPLDEALPIAQQIAEALEAAHEQGIIHRDLKPANVKLRPDGTVKVLDFGLAKAIESGSQLSASISPTLSSPAATGAGVILGTAAYMSPEQARGRAVDKRTDVWAFGCVLYEMLTATRAFKGDDVTDVIAAIIRDEPDMRRLPAETPSAIRRLLSRCLEKDRRERLPDAGTARLEIKDARKAPEALSAASPVAVTRQKSSSQIAWAFAITTTVIALALATAIFFRPAPADSPVYRASILPPDGAPWAVVTPATRFALSPDGKRLAFIATDKGGRQQLWVRSLDGLTAQALAGTDGAIVAFWSPDSRFLAFCAGGKLKKIDASGGPALTLANMDSNNGGTWNKDNVILFPPITAGVIHRIDASGGTSTPVTTLDTAAGDARHWQPFFLPDGRHFLYHAVGSATGPNEARAVLVGSLDPNEKTKMILDGGSNAQYAAGHLFFLREATLMAQPFDVDSLELTGEARPIAEQIELGGSTGRTGAFSVSQTGALAYQTGAGGVRTQLTWFDRTGKQIGILGDAADYGTLELSRDGKHASISVTDTTLRTRDIWLFDVTRGLRSRFTFDSADEWESIWSSDASKVVFSSRQKGNFDLYMKSSTGAGSDEPLFTDKIEKFPVSWSADDRYILYVLTVVNSATRSNDLWVLPLFGDKKPFPYVQTPFMEGPAEFSPDGKWVAYVSNESRRQEVFVSSFPEARGKWQVSTGGGTFPRWRPDGKEIYYFGPDGKLMAAEVNGATSGFQVGAVNPLFEVRPRTNARSFYDTADGQRFLFNVTLEQTSPAPITLLVNLPTLLKK